MMMKDDKIFHLIFPYEEEQTRKQSDNQNDLLTAAEKIGVRNLSSKKYVKNFCEFEIVNVNGKNKLLKRLLLFTSSDKQFCYEYSQHPYKPNIFHCIECRKKKTSILARIDQNNEILHLQDKEHVCEKLQYSADKYFDLQIIRKPNYEILHNCNTKGGKVLFIFNQKDKSQCHEFRWRNYSKFFFCVKCNLNIKIYNESTENEYIEMFKLKHECEFRPYNPEKGTSRYDVIFWQHANECRRPSEAL
uniref:Uncharacterized protein n=1 Tax=Panagrolaimus davidi TaxID=227884 RepID=A0A914PES9_9BILA